MGIREDRNFQNGAALLRLHRIFDSGFLQNQENISSIFYKSVFIECIIELKFLLVDSKFQKIAKTINFNDDIIPFISRDGKGYDDVITLIQYIRNTVCHGKDSEKRTNIQQHHVAYAFQSGIKEICPGDLPHLCKYDDDIVCVFGSHIIYIKRHLERVYLALQQKAFELPEQRAFKQLLDLRNSSNAKNSN